MFDSSADLLKAKLGPASVSHPEEYATIMDDLRNSGVQMEWDSERLFYEPWKGLPGRMVLDAELSIGALRHEHQHFKDIRAADYPGMGYYYENIKEFARLEARAYGVEIKAARETGNADLVPAIIQQMRDRVKSLLGL